MMTQGTLLAQRDFDTWEGLLYLLIVVLLPLLGHLGQTLRKRFGKEPVEREFDETVEPEIILVPPEREAPPPLARSLKPAAETPPPLRSPERPAPPRTRVPPARPLTPPPGAPPAAVPTPRERGRKHRPREPMVKGPRVVLPRVEPRRPPLAMSVPDVDVDLGSLASRAETKGVAWHVRLGRLDVAELQKAVILSEVLRPPLALRSPAEEPWSAS